MEREKLGLLLLLTTIRAGSGSFTFTSSQLTATEGSCVPIQGSFTRYLRENAYWAWLKDPVWVEGDKDFSGTVVYSTDPEIRPISPQYSNRVTYRRAEKQLTISICNLNKNDSGEYTFRYFPSRGEKWSSEPVLLSVQANPCLIRFEEPAPVTEFSSVTLRCSTLSSCPSRPQIQPLDQRGISVQPQGDEHSRTATSNFTASWQDNGRQFSCQTRGNTDPNLIRSVTLTVEYGPRNVEVRVTNPNRREGVAAEDTVTLTCLASGNPAPTYHWLQPDQAQSEGLDLIIPSITVSQSGRYRCEARNKHGHKDSGLDLDVQFSPEVEITASATSIRQGQKMDLRCTVKRSNPEATSFQWQKDQRDVSSAQTYTVTSIQPEHAGFYTCTAWNSIGAGTSDSLQIQVEYQPKNTRVQVPSGLNGRVSAGKELRLTCVTEAYPAAHSFSWLHRPSSHTPLSQYQSKCWGSTMTIEEVQRSDEGCYVCSATNSIGRDYSAPQCFQVQYAPSNLKLSMYTEVTEGQTFTIRCTVDSFPPSTLTLIREIQSSSVNVFSNSNKNGVHNNDLVYTTTAAVHHAGSYKCIASNSEGSRTSEPRQLVVQYSPKNVAVIVDPRETVKENTSVTFRCSAQSHPPVTSVTWTKMADGQEEVLMRGQSFTLKSVAPSDSGRYRCNVRNEVGSGESPPVHVMIQYAPKETKVLKAEELQLPDKRSSVMLTCSSSSYPPIHRYSWYRKSTDDRGDDKVSDQQNHSVTSDKPGIYYCSALNQLGERRSDPVELFVEGTSLKVLKYVSISASLLLIPFAACLILKHKRKDKEGAERPQQVRSVPLEEASVHYATVHFTKRQAAQDVVYAVVSKPRRPNEPNHNTDSEEEEEEVNYSRVEFIHKGPNRRICESSRCEEEITDYSMVKI
ncbi:B-cell receptor CD22-like isoform X1 [Synchiropus splendidus]|uniref:B-cell receptor CD22-like isoform X1 n=1 Tax=Synchiropus splendidus TaxID=270530 RepID=UPI00237E6F10|nr:B-cell receptor CD22-like isoform X1 [Synchiropus splendidus]